MSKLLRLFSKNNAYQLPLRAQCLSCGSQAQGTIEYLVIVGIVIVLSLIVVALVSSNSNSTGDVSNTYSGISNTFGAGNISVVDSIIDYDGNSLIRLNNKDVSPITLTKISVGSVDNNYSEKLAGLDSKLFRLTNLSSACPCVAGQKTSSCEIKIEYLTYDGIRKVESLTVNSECVEVSIPVDTVVVVAPQVPDPVEENPVALEDGSPEYPWIINDCVELQNMDQNLGDYFSLGNDINCTYDTSDPSGALYNGGLGFEPIGDYLNPFVGMLDGNFKTITGLTINRPDQSYVGLFGVINTPVGYIVRDLYLDEINIQGGSSSVGGLAGAISSEMGGTVLNVSVEGRVEGNGGFGTSINVGGVVGQLEGGLNFGGIASYIDSNVSIRGNSDYVGGLFGRVVNFSISNSYSLGNIDGNSYLGGIAGSYSGNSMGAGTITDSYSLSQVMSNSSYAVGGLVGYLSDTFGNNLISRCYSAGLVSDGLSFSGKEQSVDKKENDDKILTRLLFGPAPIVPGGLVGVSNNATVLDSYWDIETSTKSTSAGGGTGLTTTQMYQQANYVSWSMGTWEFHEGIGYPTLLPIPIPLG